MRLNQLKGVLHPYRPHTASLPGVRLNDLQAREKGKAPAPASSEVSIPQEVLDWQDYSRFYAEYDDDEEVEAYYFSSAAGRARITLGNRRWGENGYVSAGRMQARPVAPARSVKVRLCRCS